MILSDGTRDVIPLRLQHLTGPATTRPIVGEVRTCPDCDRPQHYTGTEYGWAHDALVDTWHCADPRKADTDRQLISHLTPGCTCDHRPGDPCNASCSVHLGAGLRRA